VTEAIVRDLAIAAAVVTVYAALLVAAAEWAERREARGRSVPTNRFVYSLALGVYATTWTFYGSVGFAARTGLLFLTVYLGPTLCAAGWWWVVRKLVRLKNAHRVTSIPDVLALRFENSQGVALLATAVLVVGLIPYVALQLKTMIVTLGLVAGGGRFAYPASGRQLGPPLLFFLLLFTIAFGLRRIRPTERHPGMMLALAIESVVKLVAFLAAGAFVVWGLFDGPADVFRSAAVPSVNAPGLLGSNGVGSWLAHLVVSGVAVLLLPRQFHVAVVENADEDHVRTAMWLFPAYLLVINLFVLPVALGALALRGSGDAADTFVLSLPLEAGFPVLSWLVFLGGFSAGTGMVIVETTALATMLSHHVVLPAADAFRPLGGLRRHVRTIRWVAAGALLLAAFAYERLFGLGYDLASIGLTSFAAVLQLAPALLGGLFWKGASRTGALASIAAGFGVWLYTLVVPVLARAGWLPGSLLTQGPFGIESLVPEGLFDLHTDRVTHAVVWSLVVNAGVFVFGSLLSPPRRPERARADRLLDVLGRPPMEERPATPGIQPGLRAKRARAVALFETYHSYEEAVALADASLAAVGGGSAEELQALEVAAFEAEVERSLAASIGAAAAHAAVRRAGLVTPEEERAITAAYGEMLAGLHLSPEELLRKIDYHRERERLLSRDAADQQFLAGVSSLLASSLDLDATAQNAVRLPVPHLARSAVLVLREDGGPRTWIAHVDRELEAAARAALAEEGLREPASVARALRTGRAVTVAPPDPAWPAAWRDAPEPSLELTLPLAGVGEPLGTLTLFAAGESRLGTPDGRALADELGRRLAIAIDNARLYASAEAAVRARDDFLAIASHELKTPLTPLRIQIQTIERLVRRGELEALPPDKLAKLVGGAEGQIVRIVGLIDKLLDLTRIRAKRFRIDVAPMDLAATVRSVIEQHAAEIRDAGCRMTVVAEAPVHGMWDRLRMEQVVANLVTNAAKYAPGSRVDVRVEGDAASARIEVRDEGPGIPLEAQERLFRPFERARPMEASGLGLGLFIVRQIVEAHGGTVALRSELGRGTTFLVELPCRTPSQA
jgi:Na+/proline symporter/nitrogen-specific signal transduction histidine kinase